MNPWMNTNEASNNMLREEQDAAHKVTVGKLTEMVRAAQQSELTELKAENAALKEKMEQHLAGFKECIKEDIDIQVAQQKEINALKEQVAQANSRFEQIRITRNQLLEELTTLQSKSAAMVDALEKSRIGLVQWHVPENRYDAINAIDAALAAFKGEK